MTRRSFVGRPLMWLIFAMMIAVPSVQLARLLRARTTTPVEPAPTVGLAGKPLPPSDTTEPFRFEPVGPAKAPIAAAAISSTGRLVAVLDDSGEVTVWDVAERRPLSSFASEQRLPMWRFSPYGTPIAVEEILGMGLQSATVAIGGNDGKLRVWRAATGQKWLTSPHSAKDAPIPSMRRAALVDVETPSVGGLFSVSSNGSLAWWSGRSDTSVRWMTRSPGGNVRDIDISSDNLAIAVAADEAVYLLTIGPNGRRWTMIDSSGSESYEEYEARMRANRNGVTSRRSGGSPQQVRFAPGGGVLASTWSTGELRVYSVATRGQLHTMKFGREGHPGKFLAFSPDGQLLAATDGGRVIQIWSMNVITPTAVALTAPRGPVRSMWFTRDGQSLVVSGYGDRYLRELPLPARP